MPYKLHTFEPLARRIGHILSGDIPGLYRWQGYRPDEALIGHYTGDEDRLLFQREENDKAYIELSQIRPFKLKGLIYHEPTVLRTHQIDASSIEILNFNGKMPQRYEYSVEFGESTSEEEAVHASVTASVKTTFGTGDASPVKGEQEFALAVTAGWQELKGKQAHVDRTFKHTGSIDPGLDVRVFATRNIQDLRRKITGRGLFECAIRIGKRYRPHGRRHQIWRGSLYWSSIADLLAVVNRDSPHDWDGAGHFREHPAPLDLKAALKPPFKEYKQWIEYQDVTQIQLVQEGIREKDEPQEEDDE